jgi:hypothetical protein
MPVPGQDGARSVNFTRPALLAHCDWSAHPSKRWMALASLDPDGSYTALPPGPVGEPGRLLPALLAQAGRGSVLAGFDFLTGLPFAYAQNIGASHFLDLLPHLGSRDWADFFTPAQLPAQISLQRPFYPARPGQARQQHLLDGLHLDSRQQLFRRCDLPTPTRRAACPIFWTLGGQQVGKAAICGWQEDLLPALADPQVAPALAVWPFSGPLASCLAPGTLTVAESYPAEYYPGLGIDLRRRTGSRWGKRVAEARRLNAPAVQGWAAAAGVRLDPRLERELLDGFGERPDGEDRFDAAAGLFGMLAVVLGLRPEGAHPDPGVGQVEGWILGMETPYNGDAK